MSTARISAANAASMKELAPELPRVIGSSTESLTLELVRADDLSQKAKDAVYALFDQNMSAVSRGTSMEYDEPSKREELFDPLARFLVLLRPTAPSPSTDTVAMPGALPHSSRNKGKEKEIDFDDARLQGFASFRFDTEETLGSSDVEVIYCYELQLKESLRGKGMGKLLMDELESIGFERGMHKSMLTCLKANGTALKFYNRLGYQPDEIDPSRMAEEESENDDEDGWEEVGSDGEPLSKNEEVEYTILSKNLEQA